MEHRVTRSQNKLPIANSISEGDNTLPGNEVNKPRDDLTMPPPIKPKPNSPDGAKPKNLTTDELLDRLATSIQTMQTSLDTLDTKADLNTASINELKNSNEKSINGIKATIDEFLKDDAEFRKEVTDIKSNVKDIQDDVNLLKAEKEKRDQEKRSLNIIIRGVPETKGYEKMHETMSLIFSDMGCSFPYSMTNGAFRIGQKQKAKGKNKIPPRNIILRLLTIQQKSELFGLAKNLRDHDVLGEARFMNDYTDEQMLVHREVQQIYTALKNKEGVSVRSKGLSIVIDGKLYNKKDFNDLPHGLTLENISTVETPDGMAFQGHNSPPSNFYKCDITDKDGRSGSSVDHIYYIRMADECNADKALRVKIKQQQNPYLLKRLGKQIQRTPEWNKKCDGILVEYMELKLNQNPSIRDKLLKYPKHRFYEATRDRTYGTGLVLAQADEMHRRNKDLGDNKAGKILTRIIADFTGDEVSD